MENLDLKLISIIVNYTPELRDFSSKCSENILSPDYRRFVKQLVSYYNAYASTPSKNTILDFCAKTNNSLREYIEGVWNELDPNVDKKEYTYLLEKINRRYNVGILKHLKNSIEIAEDNSNIEELNCVVSQINSEIKGIGTKKSYGKISFRDNVDDWANKFKARQNGEGFVGVKTYFSTLDYYTAGGIRPGELFIIGGPTGGGKSIFLLDVAARIWLGGKNLAAFTNLEEFGTGDDVLFISLEMKKEDVEDRLMSNLCDVDGLDITRGVLKESKDGNSLVKGLKFRKNYSKDLVVIEMPRGISANDIGRVYEEVIEDGKITPKIIIVDYLQLMMDSDAESDADWEKLMVVAEELHELAKKLSIPIFSAVQLKMVKAGSSTPQLFNIKRSSMIADNCDMVLEIENREDEDMRSDSRIHATKFRRGPKFVMSNLTKQFQYCRFADTGVVDEKKDNGTTTEDLTDQIKQLFDATDISSLLKGDVNG